MVMNTTKHFYGKQKQPTMIFRVINPDGSDNGWDFKTWYEAVEDCVGDYIEAVAFKYQWDIRDEIDRSDFIFEYGQEIVDAHGFRIIDVLI